MEQTVIGDEEANERIVYPCGIPRGARWCVRAGDGGSVAVFYTRQAAIIEASAEVVLDAYQFADEFISSLLAVVDRVAEHAQDKCDMVLAATIAWLTSIIASEPTTNGSSKALASYARGWYEGATAALCALNVCIPRDDIARAAAHIAIEHFVGGKPWRNLVGTVLHEIGLTSDCKDKEV